MIPFSQCLVCTGKSCENECDENEIECDGKCKKVGVVFCTANSINLGFLVIVL